MMDHHYVEDCGCCLHVDRMINEGMGGGLLYTRLSEKQLEPLDWPEKCVCTGEGEEI